MEVEVEVERLMEVVLEEEGEFGNDGGWREGISWNCRDDDDIAGGLLLFAIAADSTTVLSDNVVP
jgi:hypothetical protein